MATSIDEICGFLREEGLRFERIGDERIQLGITTENYVNIMGRKGLFIVISLSENGEYFSMFAPQAFQATGPHVDAFLRACMLFQWQTKLIQFEYDESDGEIRPVIEFPLEDSRLTRLQLKRCLHGIVTLVDEVYPVLKKALETGEIEFPAKGGGTPRAVIEALEKQIQTLLDQGAPETQIAPLRALLALFTNGQRTGPTTRSGPTSL
jgi:hypothetical protein